MAFTINKGSAILNTEILRTFNSAATLTQNDLVNVTSAGELDVVGAGERIVGIVNESATSSSTGVEVVVTPYLTLIMDNDEVGGAAAATSVGGFIDIIGGTGAQLLDTSSLADGTVVASSGQMVITEFEPTDKAIPSTALSAARVIVREMQLF